MNPDSGTVRKKVLMLASVASMISQFNMKNIRLLQDMGYQVHVVCNFIEGNTCDTKELKKLRRLLGEAGVVCHQWDCPRSAYAFCRCVKAYQQLCGLLKQESFAWMHCHSPVGGALGRLAAHRWDIPVLYTAHGFHFYQGAPLRNWLLYEPPEKLLARWTKALVTVNLEDHAFARKKLKVPHIFRIPGVGIDSAMLCAENGRQEDRVRFCEKYRIAQDAVILLSVGELSKRKNHQAVIAAMSGLPEKNICYMICGQGVQKDKLMRLAHRYNVADRIRLTGYQSNLGVFYRNADVFVFPSLQEGMPVALMEAMAAGMPCIASSIRGNRELLAEKRLSITRQEPAGNRHVHERLGSMSQDWPITTPGGILFRPNKQKELQKALEQMLEKREYWKAFGEYNAQQVHLYDISVVQKRMKQIYQIMETDHDGGYKVQGRIKENEDGRNR